MLLCIYLFPGIIIPLALSSFIAITLFPAHKFLIARHVPKFISAAILVLGVTAILVSITALLYYQGRDIVAALPVEKVPEMVEGSTEEAEEVLQSTESLKDISLQNKTKDLFNSFLTQIPSLLEGTKDMILFFISCPIYTFFMLAYSDNFKRAYYSFTEKVQAPQKEEILHELQLSLRGYIIGMFWVICIVSILTSLGLWLVGIPYAIFLGVLTGCLTIIPYIGVLISALIPCLLALLLLEDWFALGGVILVFVIVQTLEGNFITPKIVGDKVNINPLAIIVGLMLFSVLGGISAMIITVPFLAFIQVVAKNNKAMRPLYEMLKA